MTALFSVPAQGEVFLDARGTDRALRVSWHHDRDLVVLSLWRGGTCAGTFQLPHHDVPDFIDALVCGLRDGYDAAHDGHGAGSSPDAHAC